MKVKLAGYNVDVENIHVLESIKDTLAALDDEQIKQFLKLEWTPETISASYARISRDPREIGALREEARYEVEKARKSNNAIIFGMGHASIAEHACFNIDIVNISRLLAEYLEKSRLVSFTEKSQRYIKIGEDIYEPVEFQQDAPFLEEYRVLMKELFEAYNTLHDTILPYFLTQNPDVEEGTVTYRNIVNLAKEDARYILPLSTMTQVGMTLNARSLERILRKLGSHGLKESVELAKSIFNEIDGHAPSLVKYTKPTDYELKTYKTIKDCIGILPAKEVYDNDVEIISTDNELEDKVVAALMVSSSAISYGEAFKLAKTLNRTRKQEILTETTRYLNAYDPVLREFEMSDFVFNVSVSATCFAQLKRHRMATIIDGEYDPALGITIPDSIKDTEMTGLFTDKVGLINELYEKAVKKWPRAAGYLLSNAHRKHVILKCNFRELVHMARLRCDAHAQWDIRNICEKIVRIVKLEHPFLGRILCGKDSFGDSM